MRGAPEQLTLMPTTSFGEIKRAQASASRASPVRLRMPLEIICLTSSRFTRSVSVSMDRSEWMRTTWPGYRPGMPGVSAALYGVTTRYTGFSTGVPSSGEAAAICRNSLLSTAESLYPDYLLVNRRRHRQPLLRSTSCDKFQQTERRTTMSNLLWNRLISRAFSRRALFQRGGMVAAAHAIGTGVRTDRVRRPDATRQHLSLDRRAPGHQRARHLHHHHRVHHAPRSEARDGRGLAQLRPHGRADGRRGQAPRRTERRGVGHRHRGMLRRPHALHGRRQSPAAIRSACSACPI